MMSMLLPGPMGTTMRAGLAGKSAPCTVAPAVSKTAPVSLANVCKRVTFQPSLKPHVFTLMYWRYITAVADYITEQRLFVG